MKFLTILPNITSHWKTAAAVAGTCAIAVTVRRCLETEKARAERAQRTKDKEVRALADRISSYGYRIHRRYPTGEVVVGENDLAAQLRKRPHLVGTALNLLLGEQRVQKAPLTGYWKLNI
ncbi:MAG: hypothetical protein NVS1B11_31900 [Terriglobales bacterium]